ncbi:helix-turn-helix domain-containing protein [Natronobiforma cellulositropha]|uniref:helix-turn-helix domain-containing protein n=1 Tax=Natronobiforma cellulositropha TaxID=1679076 RepID=UPI0021D5E733|nr:helix-turn-helix domain-containing protein [Natronobiforma cellulositropha]
MSESDFSSEHTTPLEATDEGLEPAAAFALIGNETRLAILEALWEADAVSQPVTFSALHRAVGVRDSARFNYHLQQLTGHFITRTEAGYTFRHAGEKVVRSVIAGSFNRQPTLEPFPVEGSCVACGDALEARYEDERLAIVCPTCEHPHGEYPFPPGGLADRTAAEVADAFDQRVRHLHCLAADGVCPECSGRMETHLTETGPCCLGVSVRADHECSQCGHSLCAAVGLRLLDHSRVVAFHADRGVSLDAHPYWTLPWCVSDEYTRVLARDPWRLEVRMPLSGEELRVTLDGTLEVLETAVVRP